MIAAGRSSLDETLDADRRRGADGPAVPARARRAGGRGAVAARRVGPLDILVNNAGIIRRADAVDFTEADWDDVIDVNLKAVFFLSPGLRARRLRARQAGGAIVNIASLLVLPGRHPHPVLHRGQARRRRADQAARQRVGGEGHQRQRHRAGLHRDQQHRGAARRRRPQQGDPRPHPGRPLGRARGHRRRRGVPRLAGGEATSTARSCPSTEAGLPADPPRLTRPTARAPASASSISASAPSSAPTARSTSPRRWRASGGDWGIVGVSLVRPDQRDRLAPQGFAYTAARARPRRRDPAGRRRRRRTCSSPPRTPRPCSPAWPTRPSASSP